MEASANVLPLGSEKGKTAPSPKAQLDSLEKTIDRLIGEGGVVQWQIGKSLTTIFQDDLWQIGDYESFSHYVETRWDFTRQTAQAYMRIAATFTEKEAADFGLSELALLSKVKDDDERQKLVDRVRKEEPSFRELAEMVKEARQKNGDKTERAGLEGSIALSGRLKVGVIGEGGWKSRNGKMYFEIEIGGARFRVEDIPEEPKKKIDGGWVVKLLGPSKEE